MKQSKIKRPDDIDGEMGLTCSVHKFVTDCIYISLGSFSSSVSLKKAKLLHVWLGKAIAYLESEVSK